MILPKHIIACAALLCALFVGGVAHATCPPIPPMSRDPTIGSPFATGNRDVTLMETQTSDNVRITGGCIEPNRLAQTYFARAYGRCSWAPDGSGDNSQCILTAIAAAKLDVITASDTYHVGGAEVVLPDGDIGISQTILQAGSPAVVLRGAGAPGPYAYCKTRLKWNGAAGGTMVQFGDDSNGNTVGGGLADVCLEGNSTAGALLVGRSVNWGRYENLYLHDSTTTAWDWDVSAADTVGTSHNMVKNVQITLDSVGSASSRGMVWGPGTSSNNVHHNILNHVVVQYQNGTGLECGNADTNSMMDAHLQPILGGTGKSIDMLGSTTGPAALSECRENAFSGHFGNSTSGTEPTAESPQIAEFTGSITSDTLTVTAVTSGTLAVGQTIYGSNLALTTRIDSLGTGAGGTGTYIVKDPQTAASGTIRSSYPSFANYLRLNGRFSGAPLPVINGGASVGYDTDEGIHYDNREGAKFFTHGGMNFDVNGSNDAVFDIDLANKTNFAVAGKFGPSLPLYLHYANPIIGFNAHWSAGAQFEYGKGSSGNYAGTFGLDATTGSLAYSTSRSTGNAGDALSLTNFWSIDIKGHERVSGLSAPALSSCGTNPSISGDDRAGEVTMGTGSPTGCVITFANAYALDPYCTVTWQSNLATMQYTPATTAITVTQTGTSSNKINYVCKARAAG